MSSYYNPYFKDYGHDMRKTDLLDTLLKLGYKEDVRRKTPSYHFGLASGREHLVDTALDEDTVINLYQRAFYPHIQFQHWPQYRQRDFSAEEVKRLSMSLIMSFIMAQAMGRDMVSSNEGCLPYLCLYIQKAENASIENINISIQQEDKLRELIISGSKLMPKDKALLLTLPARTKIQWIIAWFVNRCIYSTRARRSALPVCLDSHMNLLSATYQKDGSVLIELLEPNGLQKKATSVSKKIALAVNDLKLSGMVRHKVRFQAIGKGIQTALGVWKVDSQRVLSRRGYPVCSAVCVWVFRNYTKSNSETLQAYDRLLEIALTKSPESRHNLQRKFLNFLENLAIWVESEEGRNKLTSRLQKHFKDSNVSLITSRFGPSARPLQVNLSTTFPS